MSSSATDRCMQERIDAANLFGGSSTSQAKMTACHGWHTSQPGISSCTEAGMPSCAFFKAGSIRQHYQQIVGSLSHGRFGGWIS